MTPARQGDSPPPQVPVTAANLRYHMRPETKNHLSQRVIDNKLQASFLAESDTALPENKMRVAQSFIAVCSSLYRYPPSSASLAARTVVPTATGADEY